MTGHDPPSTILLPRFWVGFRTVPGQIRAVTVRVENRLTIAQLRRIHTLTTLLPPFDVNPPVGVRSNRVIESHILVSLGGMTPESVSSGLASFDQVGDGRWKLESQAVIPSRRVSVLSPREGASLFSRSRRARDQAKPDLVRREVIYLAPRRYGGYEGRAALSGVRYDSEVHLKVGADGALTTDGDTHVGRAQFVPRTIEFWSMDRVRSVPDLRARVQDLPV